MRTRPDRKSHFGIKLSIALALIGVFVLFVLQNTETVELSFFVWRLSLSRVLLLLGSLFVGFVAGALTALELVRRKSRG